MKIRSFLLAALAMWLAVPSRAQEEPAPQVQPPSSNTLTLAEALQRALAANPGLGRARAEVGVAEAQADATRSAVLPKINLLGNVTQNSVEASFGEGSDSRTILASTDWSYRLSVTQPIWAGNRDRKALRQSKLGIESARQGMQGTEDELLLNTAANYLGVIEAEHLIEVEEANLELARGRQKQAADLFEAGETTRVESLRAESDVKAAERRLTEVRQLRENAAGRLRLLLALEGPVALSDPGAILPPPPPAQALFLEAERSRPEVTQAETALEIARLEVGKQKGALLPVVTSEGGWVSQKSPFPTDEYGFLTVHVNVPVYQGGEVLARIEAARERQRQAELSLQESKQAVREDVHQALVDLDTARASLALAQEQLTAAQAEYDQASELYRAQEITALESESAETSLAGARRAVVTSTLDVRLAELRVFAAAGLLKQSLLPEGSR